jgi:hypothetical protein
MHIEKIRVVSPVHPSSENDCVSLMPTRALKICAIAQIPSVGEERMTSRMIPEKRAPHNATKF